MRSKGTFPCLELNLSKHRQADIQMKRTPGRTRSSRACCISKSRQRPRSDTIPWIHFARISVLFTPISAWWATHLSVHTSEMLALTEMLICKHSLWSELYNGHTDWNSKWSSQRLTHSSKRTCQLVSEELGSSLSSAINQLHDSGQEPTSYEFQFPLMCCQHLPQISVRRINYNAIPSPGDFPNPGIQLVLSCIAGRIFFIIWDNLCRKAQL